jgi:hypothetical protein
VREVEDCIVEGVSHVGEVGFCSNGAPKQKVNISKHAKYDLIERIVSELNFHQQNSI